MKPSNVFLLAVFFYLAAIGGCAKEKDSCNDGIKNQNETAVDCGGSCAACPTCSDGILNQNETGIDCGGSCTACSCPYGYEGTNCSTVIRTKFLGQYTGAETCTIGTDNYTMGVTAHASDLKQITLTNVYNSAFTATATVNGSSFTVPSQAVATDVTLTGSGSVNGNTITFNYNLTITGGSANTCTFTGTKP